MNRAVAQVQLRVCFDYIQSRHSVGLADAVQGLACKHDMRIEEMIPSADHVGRDLHLLRHVLLGRLGVGPGAPSEKGYCECD